MITIRTNIADVLSKIEDKISMLRDKNTIIKSCALQMSGELRYRIHVNGEDASGNPLGEYSSKYLKIRQKKYNRTADRRIVLSLTSQMENDMGAMETPNGYGIGFKNKANLDKASYAEDRAGGTDTENKIYALSTNEQEKTRTIIHEETRLIFSQ